MTNSRFIGNKAIGTGYGAGAAIAVSQICQYPGSVLEGNVFEGNTVEQSGTGEVEGGALSFEPGGQQPTPLFQRGNVFDSNHIVSASTTSDFGGGGEWAEGASLTSIGERFSRNTLPGAGPGKWSWGGGLGILNNSCETTGAITESTIEDAVVTGNSIGAGGGDLGGAGIYVGCSPVPGNPNHLTVRDSTVTENSVPAGGSAGIDGNPGDQLRLFNSIVADAGGTEVDGFNGTGGALTASFSDVCAAGLAAPLPGLGDICADPKLANSGNPGSVDVHETGTFPGTASSPTLDAGSIALVEPTLLSDFYGLARTRTGIAAPSCSPVAAPRYVDMGATQHVAAPEAVPAIAIVCPKPVTRSEFKFPALTTLRGGLLLLTFKGLGTGKVSVLATFPLTRTIITHKGGRKQTRHRTEMVPFGRASVTYTAGSAPLKAIPLLVKLKPTKRGLAILRRRHRLRLTLTVTYTQSGLPASTERKSFLVRYLRPKHHR